MLGLIYFGLALYAILSFLRLDWGVYTILLLLPIYQIRFTFFGLPTTVLEWMVLLLSLMLLCRFLVAGGELKARVLRLWKQAPGLVVWAGLFVLAGILAVATSPEQLKALGLFKAYFFEGALFWLCLILILDSPQKQINSFYCLALLLGGLSLFGIYQFFTLYHLPPSWWGPGIEPRRVVSLYSYPNAVALLAAPILTLLAGVIVFRKFVAAGRSRLLLWVLLALGCILLLLTFSRGGWIGFGAGLLVLGFLSPHRRAVVAALLVLTVLLFAIPTSRARLMPVILGRDPASIERLKLYDVAWQLISVQPISGAGLLGFRSWYGALKPTLMDDTLNYPHNIFLNFWVETGLLGLTALLGLLGWTAMRARKMLRAGMGFRSLAIITFASLTTLVVHGLVDAPFFKNDLALLFWYLLALIPAAVIARDSRIEEAS